MDDRQQRIEAVVPRELVGRLKAEAHETRRTMSTVVQKALELYLATMETADRRRREIGCSNREHP